MTFMDARIEVFTAVKIQVEFFRVVTPCNVVVGYQRFGSPRIRLLQTFTILKITCWNQSHIFYWVEERSYDH